MHAWTIIAAAGSGTRLATKDGGRPKQYLDMDGVPLYWHSARIFASVAGIHGIVFVFPAGLLEESEKELASLTLAERFPLPFRIVSGGPTRVASVRNAMLALPPECDAVLVHDAARPFVTARVAARILTSLENGHRAVIPGVAIVDTVKEIDGTGFVSVTRDRSTLRAVQTPQGFSRASLDAAQERALARDFLATDEAMLMEEAGIPVLVVDGEPGNVKITTPDDLAFVEARNRHVSTMEPRTGFGYDVHAYGGTRPLVLGGVPIPGGFTVSAHSDGDVLLHALVDAVLGCCGEGDIGTLFPDTNPKFSGMESGVFLAEAVRRVLARGMRITHADLTVVAQTPKLAPYKERIRNNIAGLLGLPSASVNVKATTEEKLGFTGEGKGIKAYAVVTVIQK